MKNRVTQELLLIILTLLPLVIIFVYWNQLPQEVAIHYNIYGEANDWTSKNNLPYIFGGISLFLYLILLIVPMIDPKKQVLKMGNKFFIVKLIAITLVSLVLSLAVLASVKNLSFNTLYPYILISFFIVFGNYLPAVKPNYFIGIRTPWTLENEIIWTKTHRFAGKLWVIGGVFILLITFFTPQSKMTMLTIIGTLALALIPTVHSYILYKRQPN